MMILVKMKKQIAVPVSIYHAGVNPGYCFFVLPVKDNNANVIDSKYEELVMNAIIPMFMNSSVKINLNDIDYCSATVCFYVFCPSCVKMVAIIILINTAMVILRKNIAS